MKVFVASLAVILIGLVIYLASNISNTEPVPRPKVIKETPKIEENIDEEVVIDSPKVIESSTDKKKDIRPQKNREVERDEGFEADEDEKFIAENLSDPVENDSQGNTQNIEEFEVQIDQIEEQYNSQVDSLRERIILEENEQNRRALEEELIQIQRQREADLSRLLGADLYMDYMDNMIRDDHQNMQDSGRPVDGHPESFEEDIVY